VDYLRGYVTTTAASRSIRPGRPFQAAHRIDTAADRVHAAEVGGAPVALCGRRVSRVGSDEPWWDPTENVACGLCADGAARRQKAAGDGPACR
jgi:hypothetical protein